MSRVFFEELGKARAAWVQRLQGKFPSHAVKSANLLPLAADALLTIELVFEVLFGPVVSFLFYHAVLLGVGALFGAAWQPVALAPATWAAQYALHDFIFYLGHASQHQTHTFGIDWGFVMSNHLNHHTTRRNAFYFFSNIALESPALFGTCALVSFARGLGVSGVIASLLQNYVRE